MDNFALLQTAVAVVLLLASGAGVVGYFKANVSKSTIDLYKEDNDALRKRMLTLDEQVRIQAAEIKALKNAHTYLLQVVTQADQIAAVKLVVDLNSAVLKRIADKVGA